MEQPVHSEADNGQVSGSNSTAASGLSQSASTSSLPKLRLTLKVATPAPDQQAESMPPSETKKKKVAGAKVGKPRVRGPNKAKTATAVEQGNAQAESSTQEGTNGTAITLRVMEKKELPAQFAEQIQQLKELRKLKTRKWTQTQTTIKTISGASLTIPIWAREGTFSHMATSTPGGTRRASVDGTLNLTGETFPCQEPGCKKVFDAKDKLKRHQIVHKRKAAKLQLKLPSLKLTINRSEAAAGADHAAEPEQEPETAASSFPASELPSEMTMMEETQSHLESQI